MRSVIPHAVAGRRGTHRLRGSSLHLGDQLGDLRLELPAVRVELGDGAGVEVVLEEEHLVAETSEHGDHRGGCARFAAGEFVLELGVLLGEGPPSLPVTAMNCSRALANCCRASSCALRASYTRATRISRLWTPDFSFTAYPTDWQPASGTAARRSTASGEECMAAVWGGMPRGRSSWRLGRCGGGEMRNRAMAASLRLCAGGRLFQCRHHVCRRSSHQSPRR